MNPTSSFSGVCPMLPIRFSKSFALILLSPLLAAPTCHYKGGSPNPVDLAGSESMMTQGNANGVLGLTAWADLEGCVPCANATCNQNPVPTVPNDQLNQPAVGQHTVTVGTSGYRCGYYEKLLKDTLTAWVDPAPGG